MAIGFFLRWLFAFVLLALDNTDRNVWLGIFALSVVLGVGLSWRFVRRALTGQFDVDDTEE